MANYLKIRQLSYIKVLLVSDFDLGCSLHNTKIFLLLIPRSPRCALVGLLVLVNALRALSFNTARRGGGDQGDFGRRNHLDPAHCSGVLVLEDVAVKRLAAAIPDHLEANLAVGV